MVGCNLLRDVDVSSSGSDDRGSLLRECCDRIRYDVADRLVRLRPHLVSKFSSGVRSLHRNVDRVSGRRDLHPRRLTERVS